VFISVLVKIVMVPVNTPFVPRRVGDFPLREPDVPGLWIGTLLHAVAASIPDVRDRIELTTADVLCASGDAELENHQTAKRCGDSLERCSGHADQPSGTQAESMSSSTHPLPERKH
jgi:hypothetical protein